MCSIVAIRTMIASKILRSSAISIEISSKLIAATTIALSWLSERQQAELEKPKIQSAGEHLTKLAAPMGGSAGATNCHTRGNRLQRLPNPDVQGCRVLLAEDNEVNQRLVSKLLKWENSMPTCSAGSALCRRPSSWESFPCQRLPDSTRTRACNELSAWDGSGYPQGLSGEAIQVSARLMSIADVYDPLISNRVYKAPMAHEEAVKIIREIAEDYADRPKIVQLDPVET